MNYDMHVMAWLFVFSLIPMLIWIKHLGSVYEFLDSLGLINYNSDKNIFSDWDVLGDKWGSIINKLFQFLPLIGITFYSSGYFDISTNILK